MHKLICIALLVVCSALSAQQASYTYIDQPPPYSNPSQPWLTAMTLPKVGGYFSLRVPNGWRSGNSFSGFCTRYYLLLFGVSNPRLDLGLFTGGSLQGYLFSSGEVLVRTPMDINLFGVGPSYRFSYSMVIPNSLALNGTSFYNQVVGPFGGCGGPAIFSRGGHGVIGL